MKIKLSIMCLILTLGVAACSSPQPTTDSSATSTTTSATTTNSAPVASGSDLEGAVAVFICKVAAERKKNALAIFTFTTGEKDQETADTQKSTTKVMSHIANCKLRLIDKSKLKKVIDEQVAGKSGLVDSDTAPEMGRLLGAEVLVFGSLDKDSLQVRVVDATTGEILGASVNEKKGSAAKGPERFDVVKVDGQKIQKEFNEKQMRVWAKRMSRNKPLVFIKVAATDEERVRIEKDFPQVALKLQKHSERIPAERLADLEKARKKILLVRLENSRFDTRVQKMLKKAVKRVKRGRR